MPYFDLEHPNRIYYEFFTEKNIESSAAKRPVIAFLNGMTQTTLSWKSHVRAMREEGFDVLLYDARGQGQSDLGHRPLTLENHARDLMALCTHLNIESLSLAGFSHGARIALAFANLFKNSTNTLTLCSATAKPTALARTIIESWRAILKRGGLEAMSWAALPAILGEDFLEQNESLLKGIIRASVKRNSPEVVAALLEAMAQYPDLSELAENIQCPALILWASQDWLVNAQGAQYLASLTCGTAVEIPDCGHTIPIEKPLVFRKHLIDFLCK